MHKLIAAVIVCLFCLSCIAQPRKAVSTYLQGQYNHTLYDYTARNNPWSMGLGLQVSVHNKTRFQPTVELTGDLFLEDDKVLRLNPDGSNPENNNRVDAMVNLFAGTSIHPTQRLFFSFVAGPSFINRQTYLGIKPSIGYFLSENKKWQGKVSYLNVFNRTKQAEEDFGSISVAIGVMLF